MLVSIHDFKESTSDNDRTVQMALKELDAREMGYVMLNLSEEDREIIIRNMSERGWKLLEDEMISLEKIAVQQRKDRATKFFLQQLTKHSKSSKER